MKQKETSENFIYLSTSDQQLEYTASETILECVLRHGVPISHSCGGNASCGTCLIQVENFVDLLPLRNDLEKDFADAMALKKEERLACQLLCIHGLKVKI